MSISKLFYLLLEVINKAIPFLMIPYLANSMELQDYGRTELFISSYIIIGFVIQFGFDGWIAANFNGEKNQFNGTVKLYLKSIVLISMILFLVNYLLFNFWALVFIIALSNTLLTITSTILRFENKLVISGVLLLSSSIVTVTSILVTFEMLDSSFEHRIAALAISSVIIFIMVIATIQRYCSEIVNARIITKNTKQVVFFCLPLCFAMLSSWAKGNVDKFYIQSIMGFDDLAIYSVALQLASVLNVITVIINKIYQVDFHKGMSESKSQKNNILKLVILICTFAALYVATINIIFDFIFVKKYENSLLYYSSLVVNFVIISFVMIINNYFIYLKKSSAIMFHVAITSLAHILISPMMIRSHGIYGVIFTNFITSFLSIVLSLILLKLIINRGSMTP
ncbi:oligosaccharide flippase family protein [Vibrio hyugaensis]|uniref:oligosaccharide flippase family protein n=1 Tax=Vibrio hyugaensis TaxID=1534743 RepID=UPI0005EE6023|nr:oligosaccharide flippase family protein [Vibrio hyugaensis]